MSFYYPYRSGLKKYLANLQEGRDYQIWGASTVQKLVSKVNKPIIEIGGPTENGFFFLDKVAMSSEPVIANISLNPVPYSDNSAKLAAAVAKNLDGKKMPYEDNSIGMFLVLAMSYSSDWWVELSEAEQAKATPVFEMEFAKAKFEMGKVAAGLLSPDEAKWAQRVQIYLEIYRTLDDSGLLFTDGGIEEIIILQKMGFELVSLLQMIEVDKQISYEFVAIKRSWLPKLCLTSIEICYSKQVINY